MNAKSTSSRQKLMAMAIVAMFAMCAFSVCLAADSDAGPYGGVTDNTTDAQNQVYTIKISVGQTFTYTGITTNLSKYDGASVTINGAWTKAPSSGDYTGFGYSQNAPSFTGSFNKAGEYTYKFTATSTHPAGASSLTQTATQTLNFIVKDRIELPTSASGYAIVSETTVGETLITIPYKGPAHSEGITTTTLNEGGSASENFQYAYDDSGNILIKAKKTFTSTGTYKPTLTVTNTNSNDTDSTAITITVFQDIAVTNAGTHLYTYEGKDIADFTFEVNYDKDAEAKTEVNTHVLAIGAGTGSSGNTIGTPPLTIAGEDSYIVNIDTSNKTSGTYTGDNLSADFTATLKVTGIIRGETQDENVTTPDKITGEASGTVTVTVYKALEFATIPATTELTVTPITASGNAINFSAYITGAKTVIFDWGDGTKTSSMDNGGKVANTYGAYHNYAKAGLYTVTVYAVNDHGTTTSQVLYNAGEGDMEIPTDPENPSDDSEEKSFFDVPGYQVLIFLILTILLLVAFFFFGIQNPMVIIIAIVTAALTVLCFVYNDIGGVIDAVKGLFNKA